jgi:magnesium-transporting ATPase (P-type)
VKVQRGETVPADLVLLSSSDTLTSTHPLAATACDASIPSGKCQLSTSALNGETDVTSRTAAPASRRYTLEEELVGLHGEVEYLPPSAASE